MTVPAAGWWWDATKAALVAAGFDPNKVPVCHDAITMRGVLIWTGEIADDELVYVRQPWPDESWAEVAAELVATFEADRETYSSLIPKSLLPW